MEYSRNDIVLGFQDHRLGLGLALRQQQYSVGSKSMIAFWLLIKSCTKHTQKTVKSTENILKVFFKRPAARQ